MNLGSLIPWRDNRTQVPVTRDDFLDPFASFRRELDHMFDNFFNDFGYRGARAMSNGWQAIAPTIDVAESEKEVVVTVELPGLDNKDFEVTLSGDMLTIKGEKKSEQEHKNGDVYHMERRFGSFSRSIRLPFEAKDEKVDANYDRGVLTVRIPKPADAQRTARRIEVKAA
ncbi:MAG: Hsp20/alpha crystallin family protein [Rhizobiales bacterium]|nr:Hsp20/alpha crystallin family protein [Hyphomicrobiales bacterium]MBI3674412.1 Hsp20/alpha crystallin family protein [Hyphomicrobiales bacterium]